MTVTILVPPTSIDLTTVEHVEQELGIPAGTETELLQRYIRQASDAIVDHCGRRFGRATYRESVPGYGDPRALVSELPVRTIGSVLMGNEPVLDYELEDPEAGILFRKAGWSWNVGLGWGGSLVMSPRPGTESPQYIVEYEAGWTLPTAEDPGDLPTNVERAAILTVKSYWQNRARNLQVSSKRIGDVSINYVTQTAEQAEELSGLPPEAVGLLARYRA